MTDWLLNLWKSIRYLLGTPGVSLMTPEDMYMHVAAYIEFTKDNPELKRRMYTVWRVLGEHLIQRSGAKDWDHFLDSNDNAQLLYWSNIVGSQVKRANKKGGAPDAMATQLLAILLRAKTMNDPLAVGVDETLTPIITMAGIGEPFVLE